MTKKNMNKQVDEWGINIPWHLGYELKALGEVLIEKKWEQEGLFLDKESRQERGKEPLATVGDVTTTIETMGGVITISQADPNRPLVTVPVGISDKVTTATIPWQKITGYLFQTLISVFDGDATYAMDVIKPLINQWIDDATEHDDTGRLKINQDKLPEIQNTVEVAQFLESLKRQSVSKSKGTPILNVSLDVSLAKPQTPSAHDMAEAEAAILSNSTNDQATTGSDDASLQTHSTSGSHLQTPSASVETEAADGGSVVSTITEQREQVTEQLRAVLGSEKRTIGFIKKEMDSETKVWRPRLDAMIRNGEVCKEGERRSCRYYLDGVGA